jgi:hypothetical protein
MERRLCEADAAACLSVVEIVLFVIVLPCDPSRLVVGCLLSSFAARFRESCGKIWAS